ncbi:MAG TPA: hypothetical protein VN772_05190 [Solirubrobacteraceae bacterium]|nr:hypothetical protein [Solirubrobacteraceae bacterium]
MRRKEMMTAAGATLAGLGVLVGLAIGSTGSATKLVAQHVQPVEVRTEVIRKTVNVYRRAKPQHVAAAGPGHGAAGASAVAPIAAAATTRTSPGHAAGATGAAAPVVSTRASGVKSTSGSGSSEGSGSVKTRTSGGASSGGGSGSGKSVSTRSSGGGGGEGGGGHDD